ncbi:hypothetical protein IEE87_27450 (plasmid) [Klebsiella pneumoniae]|nr:hypothetical protein IEE87_27450 [Klebsiella pneumoniae]
MISSRNFGLFFFEEATLENRESKVVKSCPASSNKNSQTKIASHIFRLVGLITADESF